MRTLHTKSLAIPALLAVVRLFAQVPPVSPSLPGPGYLLGPGDQLSVYVSDLPEDFTSKTFRIDNSGDLSLPVAGHLHAAGLTTFGLESEIKTRLSIMKNPQVNVSISGFGSQSVSVLGAVNQPGIRQLEGNKTLIEMLSAAGGLRPDAGFQVKVIRNATWGVIPLPGASADASRNTSVVTIKLRDLMNDTDSANNIAILPGDTISVPKADVVYAVGSIVKPGGFALNDHETISALQVISLAEGLQKTAATERAKIIRTTPGTTQRIEIAVNLKQLLSGKGSDILLQPNDILFVPNSKAKSAGYTALSSIIAAATGAVIYGTGHI